jgi:putative membrane protein
MTALTTRLLLRPTRADLPYLSLIGLWILSMISVPIIRWTLGDDAVPLGVTITVILQAGAVLSVLRRAWGLRRVLFTVTGVVILAWFIEFIGSSTGFPFGVYDYTQRLQPQIGHVPLLIPLAWLMMLPPAWAAAAFIVGKRSRLMFIGVSALVFTAWDLFLDPQMVAWGFWEWAQPSGYFGIPWVNFLGWLLASACITAIVRPPITPLRPLLLIYGITWLFETIGLFFFWGLPGPALVGFIAMGSALVLAVRRLAKGNHAI